MRSFTHWNENCRLSRVGISGRRFGGRVGLLALGVILTGAAGNALLRLGVGSAGPILTLSPMAYIREFARWSVLTGVIVLIAGYILQLSLLSWADLTFAVPVTSASYVLIPLVGALGLHEHVSLAHWMGVLLILCGVIVVGRTRPLTPGSGL